MASRWRVGIFPDPYLKDRWNNECNQNLKYWADSISAQGYEVVGVSLENLLNLHELKSLRLDLLHVHWPEAILGHFAGHACYDRKRMLLYYVKIKWDLSCWLKKLRGLNIPLVLQIHDLACHQYAGNRPMQRLDLFLRRALYATSRLVLTQEHSSIPCIEEFYGRKPFGVTFLGDFQSFHGQRIAKAPARQLLGIPLDKKVFLFMGTARPNRNPGRAIEVFNAIDHAEALLLVAGMHNEHYRKVSRADNVLFYPGMLDNEMVRNILCAADFLINDGVNYLTSGVLRCAMSYGLPVITYHYGAAIDMTAGAAIEIRDDQGGLMDAVRSALQMSAERYADCVKQAGLRNSERSWRQCGEVCDLYYRDILNPQSSQCSDD